MSMFTFFKKLSELPDLEEFPLKTRSAGCTLDRLVTGIDNVRCDVHLSSGFCKTVSKIVGRVIANHTHAEDILDIDKSSNIIEEKTEFKRLCHEIMTDGINKSKLRNEIQIDFMVQAAIVKLLMEEIQRYYEKLTERLKHIVRGYELSRHQHEAIQLKEKLADVQQHKRQILSYVGNTLFEYFMEVQDKIKEIRKINFGSHAIFSDFVFSNPMLHIEDIHDDFFMIEEYSILLGRRIEDPDKYETLISLIKHILSEVIIMKEGEKFHDFHEIRQDEADLDYSEKIDRWLMEVENMDILFDYPASYNQIKSLKQQKKDKKEIVYFRNQAKKQKKLLNFFYKRLKKKGIIIRAMASYEMQPVYLDYCPPLVPQLVLQFIIERKVRKSVENRLKRLKSFYGKSFSLTPLWKLIKKINRTGSGSKKKYLIRFLKDFIRYHRDFQNLNMLKTAMDRINLVREDKLINLSRANNTLYEFLLPHEQTAEEKPIIRHVIIKADVRGSTDITHRMKERGLNPASHFSLNFFDPITEILPEYGASKVFVEGDAIILSVFEREDTPRGWYSVARSCGLAANMLSIVRRCNVRNRKYQLPIIELGIGICYHVDKPAFLFDGDNRIMISSAINLADRLSGCSKTVRKQMAKYKGLFNLFLFQTASEEEIAATADDLFLRYNVNGIELNAAGFKKLREEIDLKFLEIPVSPHFYSGISLEHRKEKIKIYIGRFPTTAGKYQQLIIREGQIPRVDPDNLNVTDLTARKYYEVCTSAKLYEYIREYVKKAGVRKTYPKVRN